MRYALVLLAFALPMAFLVGYKLGRDHEEDSPERRHGERRAHRRLTGERRKAEQDRRVQRRLHHVPGNDDREISARLIRLCGGM